MSNRRGWTEEEVAALKRAYSVVASDRLSLDRLAKSLGREKANVCRKARTLGLTDQRRPKKTQRKLDCYGPMFSSDSERRAAVSEAAKKRIAERGHPRGATGLVHTPEARALMGAASRRYWRDVTPEQSSDRIDKMLATRIAKHGTGRPGNITNAYSRAKRGKRDDLGGMFFRSAWEANYARYLDWLQQRGEIQRWQYEPETFVFHGVTRGVLTYTPDFKVYEGGGHVFHEVKGWMDAKSKAKLKRMADHYPSERIIVIGPPEYRSIAKWSGLIPMWES